MKFICLSILSIFLVNSLKSLAQSSSLQFVENKGQWNEKVTFKGDLNNGVFFLTKNGFTVVQHNADDLNKLHAYYHAETNEIQQPSTIRLRSHAYEMVFVNATASTTVTNEVIDSYNNYFIGNDASKWAGNCKIAKVVEYMNMYAGIDVKYYSQNAHIKYDIVVKPMANVANIKMQYKGADAVLIENENLVIKTSTGDIKELAPYAYQVKNGIPQQVSCKFKVTNDIVTFEIGNYDHSKELIIDPSLIFSTFTGSTADNWGYTATYGIDGTAYAAGLVFGSGYPTSIGAYDNSYNGGIDEGERGGIDIGIIKFSADGTSRIYATYLGGSNNEHPHSIIADSAGNLVIAGRTTSNNFPTTQPTIGNWGNGDIFITKLNAAGNALIGSIKIGGSGKDGINIRSKYLSPFGVETIRRNYGDDSRSEVSFDNNGDIIFVSSTQSTNFPVTSGAFQTSLSGRQDGVIIRASADVSNVFYSTYLGGSGDDAAFAVAINPTDNNIYVMGNTTSNNVPGDKTGVLYNSYNGGETEGFISILSPVGALLKTGYWGTTGNDMLFDISFDNTGSLYMVGTTSGSWPIVNAAFSQSGGKQFICKVQPNLSGFIYSTVFGTNSTTPNLSITAIMVDQCQNVFVSGWGGSVNQNYPNAGTTGWTVTPNAFQSTTDNSDFYFFVLGANATKQLYGSFFGGTATTGEHVDGGTSRFDPTGTIYQAMCACGTNNSFPTTPGVWSATNGSPNCNQAVVKFKVDTCGAIVPIRLQSFTGYHLNNKHILNWKVSNEEKGDTYIVERKQNVTKEFSNVFQTKALSDNNANTYSIELNGLLNQDAFYRLKIISVSGRTNYSPVIRIHNKDNNTLNVNIFNGSIYIDVPLNTSSIAVYSADGKLYYKQDKVNEKIMTFPISNLPKGLIVVKALVNDNLIIKKVIF